MINYTYEKQNNIEVHETYLYIKKNLNQQYNEVQNMSLHSVKMQKIKMFFSFRFN